MKKILIIDNSIDILDAVDSVLTIEGYETITSYEPGKVFELINEHQPDVILLDIMMGVHDGRNICNEIKSRPEFEHIKIILFSASRQKLKDYELCKADGILEKPFDFKDLLKAVSMFILAFV